MPVPSEVEGNPDERSLLHMAPALQLVLTLVTLAGGGQRWVFFRPDQSHGAPPCGPIGAFSFVVIFQPLRGVVRNTDIERITGALEDVAEVHSRTLLTELLAQNARSGHHILIGYGGGGGSRTPVRKALRPEAYMLSSIRLGSPAAVRMSKKRSRLVR